MFSIISMCSILLEKVRGKQTDDDDKPGKTEDAANK